MTKNTFLTASVDLRRVERGLRDVLRRAERAGPFFRDERKPLREDQREHATTRRARGRRRLLGKLLTAVSYRPSADALRAESRIPWSGVHQHGGRAGRGAQIPARTFLYFGKNYLRDMAERFLAYALAEWGRR
jgi:phage gpG-like protein